MNPAKKKTFFLSILFTLALLVSACTRPSTPTPAGSTGRGFALDWYVETTGDDGNPCNDPTRPCRTIRGVFVRLFDEESRLEEEYPDLLSVDHTLYIGPGTYTGISRRPVMTIYSNIDVIGAGSAATILDAAGLEGGIGITSDGNIRLQGFTVRNTIRLSASGCIHARSDADVVIEDVVLENCFRSGVANTGGGFVQLIDVVIRGAVDENTDPDFVLNGYGIENSGEMQIEGGEISGSQAAGILNTSELGATGTIIRDNNTEGIRHMGTLLLLDDVTISGNGSFNGVRTGISAFGSGRIRINDSRITANLDTGIFLAGSHHLIMDNTTVSSHDSVGLSLRAGTTSNISNSFIDDNGGVSLASDFRGFRPPGIYNEGNLTMSLTSVSGNGYGGIYNAGAGRAWISESIISNNRGDVRAVYNQDDASFLSLSQSLVAHNQTGDDAAVESFGEAHILNSTISNNSGLGVLVGDNTRISFATIAENGRQGILPRGFAVDNTIIAGNATGDCINDFGLFASTLTGLNIDSDGSCGFGPANTFAPAALLLGPLADNGGATQTHALLDGSPAVDAASGSCLPTDQRGTARPVGGGCDVGAYEKSFAATSVTPISGEAPEMPTVNTDTPCWKGPGPAYEVVSSVQAGTQVALLGIGELDGWFIIDNPRFPGVNCWLDAGDLDVNPELDLNTLQVFAVPPLPTPTPTPLPTATFTPVPVAPAAPSGLAANTTVCNGGYQATVTWKDNASNEDGYRVYRDGNLIATLGPNVTMYVDNPPGSGPHTYHVEAFNNAGAAQSNSDQDDGCLI